MQNLLMMMVRGVAIGAIISAPMGPVGILCVQRTLDGGRRHGFYTGIGAALSDLFYCLLTGFGLSFIEGFLQNNQQIIQILGSIVLIGFGIYIMRKNPAGRLTKPPVTAGMKGKDVLSGFLFTFSNPLILFLIIGLFARFNFQSPDYHWYHYVMGYISIVAGAVGWWWLITFIINKIRAHFNLRSMWIVNRVIGIIILIFALFGIISAFSPDAKARIAPVERIVRSEIWHPASDPVPITVSASGPQTGRLSFKRDMCGDEILTGIDLSITNTHQSLFRNYTYTDSAGKRHKVRRPAIMLYLKDNESNVSHLSLQPAEPSTYSSEESGCETRVVMKHHDGTLKEHTRFSGGVSELPLYIDIRGNLVSIGIGDNPDIAVHMPAEIDEIVLEPGRGGELRVESLQTWSIPKHPFNSDIASLVWNDSERIDGNLKLLGIQESNGGVSGLWRLYSSSADETLMRKGGDYDILILPASDSGSSGSTDYEIWYISGATITAEEWSAGMLKGKLSASPYIDDWKAIWYDTEGRSCGEDIRAHMNDDTLTIFFPRHNTRLLFVRDKSNP